MLELQMVLNVIHGYTVVYMIMLNEHGFVVTSNGLNINMNVCTKVPIPIDLAYF